MLDENGIITAVCDYLERSEGYIITQRLSTTQKGIDIIAKHPNHPGQLLIEAKGGTSSRAGSPKFGEEYNSTKVLDRVSKGFYTVAQLHVECKDEDNVALACPDTKDFRKFLDPIKPILNELGIKVYLVQEDRTVIYL